MPLSRTQLLLNQNSEALLAMQQGDHTGALRMLQGCFRQLRSLQFPPPLPQEGGQIASADAADPIPDPAQDDRNGANEEEDAAELSEEDSFLGEDEDIPEAEEDDDEETSQDARAVSVYNIPINIHGLPQDDQVDTVVVTDTSVDVELLTSQNFQVFEDAIATTSLDCEDGEFHLAFLSAILAYNMGLCFYQIAKMQRANRSAQQQQLGHPRHPLSRAAALYELALRTIQLVAQEGIDEEGNYRPDETRPIEQDMVLLMLAVRNNLCHINATFLGNLPAAWECVQHMRMLLTHMYNTNMAGQRLPLMLDRRTPYGDFFSINIFFFLTSQSHAASTSGAA